MPKLAINVVPPIFRHFIPLSLDLQFHTPQLQSTEYFKLDMKKYLIQGAFPINSSIISKNDNVAVPQFQGGYRCTLEIVTLPSEGEVKLSDDLMGFAYRPTSLVYRGGDSFSYRIRSLLGQSSNVACISLFVRV